MTYQSTKTFGHDLGLSCCFRQWKAKSHCRLLHGYALSIKIIFEADELDHRNWVVDFGGMATLKQWIVDTFDHKLLVATDDPHADEICALAGIDVADVVMVSATGCEMFAEMIFNYTWKWLERYEYGGRIKLHSVEVREHGANSAVYVRS